MPQKRGIVFVAGLAALAALAQDSAIFRVDVDVVNVLATVRDRDGRIVKDLQQGDFVLEESGKPQTIQYFARQTDLPLTIGLLVDTSLSQMNLLENQRQGSRQFFDEVLRPDRDAAFVIGFDTEVELVESLTNSKEALTRALDLLETPRPQRVRMQRRPRQLNWQGWPGSGWPRGGGGPLGIPGGRGGPGGSGGPGGGRGPGGAGAAVGTTMYDAVFLAADEVLKNQTGRKTIILISDGVDQGSKVSQSDAIEKAQRADAIIYSIRYYDKSVYGGFMGSRLKDGQKALETMAQETGGRLFDVDGKLTLHEIYTQIQEELRNQYSLGYKPAEHGGGNYRQISLRTTNNRLKVQTRAGYYRTGAAE